MSKSGTRKKTPVYHAKAYCSYDFSIPLSQAENERDFSHDGVFTGSNCARMLVDMISKLVFNNRKSIGIQNNQTSDVFKGPVDDLNKVTETIEEYL